MRSGLGSGCGNAAKLEDARLAEIQGRPRKYKNSGNEAKNLLKTKDITFLKGANFVFFACKSTRIEASQEQKRHILHKRTETCKSPGEAGTVASTRLHRTAVTLGHGSRAGGNVR